MNVKFLQKATLGILVVGIKIAVNLASFSAVNAQIRPYKTIKTRQQNQIESILALSIEEETNIRV